MANGQWLIAHKKCTKPESLVHFFVKRLVAYSAYSKSTEPCLGHLTTLFTNHLLPSLVEINTITRRLLWL